MRIPFLLTLSILFLTSFSAFAQYEKEWLRQMSEEDYSQIEVLAMYPADTRAAILEAAQHPQVLIKIKHIQEQTSSSFTALLEYYASEDQQAIWDLTRYSGLIEGIAYAEPGTLESVLKEYPEVIHNRARQVALKHPDLLSQIATLQSNSAGLLESVLKEYPPYTVEALNQLIELPEVISILTNNIELTMVVGELYRKEPLWVNTQADSLHLALARQQAQELEDWKTSTANDPEALAELKETSQSYAKEYGYDDDYYTQYENNYYSEVNENVIIRDHYYYNYPYWLGYPSWYSYPRWRPYPWYYDWGFYYPPGGSVLIFSLPSYHCVNWYFYQNEHHYYHPYLSAHFASHYYGHRHTGSSIARGVQQWEYDNRDLVDDKWMSDDKDRVKRFKELGQFEKERENYNNQHQGNTLSKADYLAGNKDRFQDLRSNPIQKDKEKERIIPVKPNTEKPSSEKPRVSTPVSPKPNTEKTKYEKPRVSTPVSPKPNTEKTKYEKPKVSTPISPKPNTEKTRYEKPRVNTPIPPTPKVNRPVPPKSKVSPIRPKTPRDTRQKNPPKNILNIEKAKDYHQNKWEQIKQ